MADPHPDRAATDTAGPPPAGRVWPWLIPILIVHALAARRHFWVTDDAFITFRYAKNLVNGFGLRFNTTDLAPVEGFSNFLWLLAAAVLYRLGIPPELGTTPLSVACGSATLVLVAWTARHHLALDRLPALGATAALALFAPFVFWSTSGLEMMAFTLAFFVTAVFLGFSDHRAAPIVAAAGGLAMVMLRVEGLLWLPVLAVAAAWLRHGEKRPVRGPILRFLLVVGAGSVLYNAWRIYTFGDPIPNTVRAKVINSRAELLARGIRYVAVSVLSGLLPLSLPVALAVTANDPRRRRWIYVVALAVAVACWSVLVGGDYMPQFRFLVPGAPFVALAVGAVLQAARRSLEWPAVAAIAVAVTVLGYLPARGIVLSPRNVIQALSFVSGETEFQGGTFVFAGERRPDYLEWMVFVKLVRPGERAVIGAIGRNGYYSEAHIIDQCGLVARQEPLAEVRAKNRGRRAGHDGCLPPRAFYELRPDILTLSSFAVRNDNAADVLMRKVIKLKANDPADAYYPTVARIDLDGGWRMFGIALRKAVSAADHARGWEAYREGLRTLRAQEDQLLLDRAALGL